MKVSVRRAALAALVLFLLGLSFGAGRPAASRGASGPWEPDQKYSPEELKADLKVLWDVLDEGHAGIGRYISSAELKKRFDAVSAGLTGPMTDAEFCLRVLPLVVAIKDGHTRLGLSLAATRSLEAQPVFFPFGLRFLDGKTYIYRNLSSGAVPKEGAELLAVNGMPIDKVLAELVALVPSDAGIRTRPVRQLEFPAMFGQLFALRFGRPQSFRITYRPLGAAGVEELQAPGITAAEVNSRLRDRYPDSVRSGSLYDLSFKGTTAVLTIRAFADSRGQGSLTFPDFLLHTFQTLSGMGVPALVIDLRGNGGGRDEYGKYLFAYVMNRPFLYYSALECKKASYDLFRYTDISKEAADELAGHVRKNEHGWFDILGHPNTGLQQPMNPQFRGKVAILIDGLSFSATGETTSLFHYHHKAVFFGEECGAGYYGNSSGFMTTATLPNTKLQIRLPLMGYRMAVDGYPEDRGIVPDFPVTPTIEDLLAGRDPVMDRALKYLSEKRP